MRIVAVRHLEPVAEVGAEDVVVGVIAPQRGDTGLGMVVGAHLRAHVVRGVTVASGLLASRPVVAVEILPVARRRGEGEIAPALHPAHRSQPGAGRLVLVGIVGGIKAVRAETAALIAALQVEIAGPLRIPGHPHIAVPVVEIGIRPITVAAAVGARREEFQATGRPASGQIAVGIAVAAARSLETQVTVARKRRADIHGTGIGAYARHAVDQLDPGDAVQVDGQRVGLMPGAGIRKIDTVQKDHRLVERPASNQDIGLHSPGAALPQVDRGRETQGRLQRVERRRRDGGSIEQNGRRHGAARGIRFGPHDSHFVDLQHLGIGHRIDFGGLRLTGRKRENGRHPDRKHSDGHRTPKRCEYTVVRTTPTLEARTGLHGLDLFHFSESFDK